AAAAAAIAAPFVIGGLGSDDAPVPPTTQSPSPSLVPQPDIGRDWPVTQRLDADLDGDGTTEKVRVHADGDEYVAERLRLEADLSGSGEQVFGVIAIGNIDYHLSDWLDVDSDGDHELLVWVGSPDERPEVDLRVLDLVEDQLVPLEQTGEVEIQNGPVLDRKVDDRVSLMFQTAWWVDDGTLYSSRSVNSYPVRGMSQSTPDVYRAHLWAWQQTEPGTLAPVPQDEICMSRQGDAGPGPVACPPDGVDLPDFFPELTGSIGVGESFGIDYGAGSPDTVALEADGSDVDLVMTSSYAGEQRLALPDGASPVILSTPVNVGAGDGLSFLVAQESGGSTAMMLVSQWDGRLVAADVTGDVPFGSGVLGSTETPYRTWLGPGDIIYTSVGPEPGGAEPAAEIYTWDLVGPPPGGGGPSLASTPLGTFCISSTGGEMEVARCDG
ncbi:MAG: hypothetical protein M3237_00915, partial [Actinomycetota bacterium]|nr:hypothetical protein [Actinomycetota bacterium]